MRLQAPSAPLQPLDHGPFSIMGRAIVRLPRDAPAGWGIGMGPAVNTSAPSLPDGGGRRIHERRTATRPFRRVAEAASLADAAFAVPAPRACLSISLLGEIGVSWQGRPVNLGGRNGASLVAVLALHHRARSREAIAADLWPDAPGQLGAAWLRQALWLVRRGLLAAGADPATLLDATDEAIGFRAGLDLDVDVRRFEAMLEPPDPRPQEAVQLYAGEFVEASALDCFARERERIADLYEDALVDAARIHLARGEIAAACRAALRILGRDPLREEAHGVLIESYGIAGSRSQVARQYRRLRAVLDAELDVEPLPETEVAYRRALLRARARSAELVVGADQWSADEPPSAPGRAAAARMAMAMGVLEPGAG